MTDKEQLNNLRRLRDLLTCLYSGAWKLKHPETRKVAQRGDIEEMLELRLRVASDRSALKTQFHPNNTHTKHVCQSTICFKPCPLLPGCG